MNKLIFFLLLSTQLSYPGLIAAAEKTALADENWSVITCDGNLFMDYLNNTVTFYNNVTVKNPRGELVSNRLIVYFSEGGKKVEKTEGIGKVKIRADEKTGWADRFLYFPAQKTAILLGNARVKVGENIVRGGKITFYLDRKEMEVEEAPDIRFLPEEDLEVNF